MDLCEWWPSNIARRSGRLFVGCHVLGRACIVVEPFRPAELDACGACGIFLNLVYMYSPKVRTWSTKLVWMHGPTHILKYIYSRRKLPRISQTGQHSINSQGKVKDLRCSAFHRLDMTLAVAEAWTPNNPNPHFNLASEASYDMFRTAY